MLKKKTTTTRKKAATKKKTTKTKKPVEGLFHYDLSDKAKADIDKSVKDLDKAKADIDKSVKDLDKARVKHVEAFYKAMEVAKKHKILTNLVNENAIEMKRFEYFLTLAFTRTNKEIEKWKKYF